MNTSPTPVLLLEINEVPWRLVDAALTKPEFRNLRAFFARAKTYTTVSTDEGELSPWQTWPSLHRGMKNTEHGVMFLGQDVSTFRGVPIWEEFRRRKLAVGICGSMQSWPPMDPGPGGFYVPDTFAADATCIPAYVEPLQRFNLDQVRSNGRVIGRSLGKIDTLTRAAVAAARCRVSPRTIVRVATQLFEERRDERVRARRPTFQGVLFWDVFKSLYDPESPPAFATFFTNHVASVMHRYWDHVFPDDFPEDAPREPYHRHTMTFALEVLDEIIGDALAFQRENPAIRIVFATSMGQAAVHRSQHERIETAISNIERLIAALGVPTAGVEPRLAMVPQAAVQIEDDTTRRRVTEVLESARTMSGQRLFDVDTLGTTLSVTIITPRKTDIVKGGFEFDAAPGRRAFVSWEDASIAVHEIERGTGYHIPEGVMAIVGRDVPACDDRERILATSVKSLLLDLAKVDTTEAA